MDDSGKLHELDIKITKVEASEKSAHKRMDNLEEESTKHNTNIQTNTQNIQKTIVIVEGLTKTISEIQEYMKSSNELTIAIHEIAGEMKAMRADVTSIAGRVKAIEDKPAKRWESVIEKVILVVVGGVISFMLTRIGM